METGKKWVVPQNEGWGGRPGFTQHAENVRVKVGHRGHFRVFVDQKAGTELLTQFAFCWNRSYMTDFILRDGPQLECVRRSFFSIEF